MSIYLKLWDSIYGKTMYISVKSGPGNSNGKALDYVLDVPGSIPGIGGGGDFLHSFCQTDPGVHSASY